MGGNEEFRHRNLRGAVFQDCAMGGARFEDVDLSQAAFANVSLRGARFDNVDLSGVSIDDANIRGLTILGHDIPALIDAGAPAMAVEPQLFVSDIGAACRFYREGLGFAVVFTHGDPPFYAQVARGGGRLNLRRVEGPVFDAGFRDREADALSATFTLDDVVPLFRAFQEAGVPFHQPLETQPWGARTFIVRDPDGNLICFAGPRE